MKSKLVVYRDGFRYWATKKRQPDGRLRFTFWSSHEWPFYHGHVTLDRMDAKLVRKHFMEWIPQ